MHGTPTADYVRTWKSHTKLVGRGRRRGPGRARIIDVGGGDGTGASGSGVVFWVVVVVVVIVVEGSKERGRLVRGSIDHQNRTRKQRAIPHRDAAYAGESIGSS